MLAFDMGVSTITLERLFKKELNLTPGQYHFFAKMEYAKDLLSNSDLSIKEIAFHTNSFSFIDIPLVLLSRFLP
ncbi:MAG: helix-turn-helix domain-containing protein [Victivallales bacterium]|nr:helix-turn-helix domain-containing protein [Victivallales bacterium]